MPDSIPLRLLRDVSQAAAQRAIDTAPIPKQRPGTVTTASATTEVSVLIDGDSLASTVQNITGDALAAGTRVMVQLWPPHGAFVVGAIQGATPAAEAWRFVGAAGQPAFQNSWVNFGAGVGSVGFYRDALGWVHLTGTVKTGSSASAVIFTLPSGYRPPHALPSDQSGMAGGTFGLVRVAANGDVSYAGGGSTSYASLDGVSFPSSDFYSRRDFTPLLWTNGWAPRGTSDADAELYARSDGWCWLGGSLAAASVAAAADIGVVPEAARSGPLSHLLAFTAATGTFTRMDVLRTAVLRFELGGDTGRDTIGGKNWWSHRAIDTWTAPTLLNSWANYGLNYAPAGYRLDDYGRVHLQGLIAGGTATPATVLFTLPAGYRPTTGQLVFPAASSSGTPGIAGRVDVATNGNVSIVVGGNTFLSLSGIHFRADA